MVVCVMTVWCWWYTYLTDIDTDGSAVMVMMVVNGCNDGAGNLLCAGGRGSGGSIGYDGVVLLVVRFSGDIDTDGSGVVTGDISKLSW